ncbi:ribonuclease E activity regulator RraA [Chromobacterium violaceum]|uniref:ribonuclease E activity regulator RraA n=1 Tax=Chromobacterium violaceum TaxID=536 RepID=UPI0005D45FB0|nr:ribonuclease E activity regulator RraA [Chromobacterium violaceum]KJH68689.1 ribonuclease activity regulator protein RraA [Chromobacterium violaceum]KMN51294.1 ribonuclease activity regulator protein RraA [Chromobacterium violaceum]KMN86091.1 ribonuclease activity regulator protein RraA [Chromobacterium violaceum]KMN90042.1 ribonuclease activity regulator protein RraA [Chromobacterium violaceum]KMO04629.1 ribonuclease activity regulator protein RraA [Chromobacterium violaceum]
MSLATTDLCDAFDAEIQVLDPVFQSFGGHARFHGPIATLKLFEDNSLVRQMLGEPGNDRVLVVDGGGSRRCALLGDQLGELAVKNGWAGLVIDGCVRDSAALGKLPLGVKALAAHPRKSVKRDSGQRDLPLRVAGCDILPGQWLYADEDGVIVSGRPLG